MLTYTYLQLLEIVLTAMILGGSLVGIVLVSLLIKKKIKVKDIEDLLYDNED